MAGRALSELNASFTIPWLERDWPLSEADLGPGPLTVEIGFGDGEYLCEAAASHPERAYLGVEVSWGLIQRALLRLDREGIGNVRIVKADAGFVFRHLLDANTAREVIINHPDPWHKERHYSRRLIQGPFVEDVTDILAPGGTLHIATDHNDYAHWIADVLECQNRLVSSFPTTVVSELPGHRPTRYQRQAQSAGIHNHFFVWEKAAGPSPARPRDRVGIMPNITLQGSSSPDELFRDFEPRVFRTERAGEEVLINFMRAFRLAGDEPLWLIETLIREGHLSQHVGIVAIPHGETKITIKTGAFGFPRPTWGVRRALDELASIVLAAGTGMSVASSTLGDVRDPTDEPS